MNIFTKDFKKALINRGKEYLKTIRPYKSELQWQELFEHFNKPNLSIREIRFMDGSGNSIEEFETYFDTIKIFYSIESKSRCGGYDNYDYEIELPSWIIDDRETFIKRLAEHKKWYFDKAQEAIWDEKRKDKKKLFELADKLGFKIQKKEED